MSKPIRSGAGSTKLRDEVLALYGTVCWLQLPGCTIKATTKDHVIPVIQGGTDAMDNLRPACGPCNSKRRDLAIGGTPGGILVTFHIGPLLTPCTEAATVTAHYGDVVISPEPMLAILSPRGEPTPAGRKVATRAFNAAVQQSLRMRYPCHVRIAHPTPTPDQLQVWARLKYFIEVHDPGRAEAERQAESLGRPALLEARKWYNLYPEGQASIERVRSHRPIATVERDSVLAETVKPSRAW